MLPHDYPHPPRTSRIIAKVHGGRGMLFGNANKGTGNHVPWGSTAEHTTRGFRHVRNKGPPGTLVPDDPPHAVRHKTPTVLLKTHHSTWGGPTDHSHDPATNTKHTNLTKNRHKPNEKDGHWLHQTKAKARNSDHVLATGGSVAYDFIRPNLNYNDQNGLLNIQGSQQYVVNPAKKVSHAYTSGAGDHDMITHKLSQYAPPQPKRQLTPHTLKTTLMKKAGTHKSNPRSSHHHGYHLITNQIWPEHQSDFDDYNQTMKLVTTAKNVTKLRPHDTLNGHQGHIPGGPIPYTSKTSHPKAVLHSEGYAYDILTHREVHGERLTRFDKASTKSFRRLANAHARKITIKEKGRLRAEKLRQRRVNTIAITAHVPRKQQNRGFNIVTGSRWRDLPKNDPRRCPKKTGNEPKSVWAKCGHLHNNRDLKHNPFQGLKNTRGRAMHTKLPPQQLEHDQREGVTTLASRVTREPKPL
jgi:hypothetical protein